MEPNAPKHRDDVTLVDLVNVILRHRWLVLGCALALGSLAAVWSLTRERTFTASASFMQVNEQSAAGGAAALAQQLGFSLGEISTHGYSPQFYADLLRSRELLRQAVQSSYRVVEDDEPGVATLIELGDFEDNEWAPAWQMAVEEVRRDVSTSITPQTGVVEVRYTHTDPAVAEQVVARLLELLHAFNVETRQAQALEEARFAADRLGETADSLYAAEGALQRFLEGNRNFESSPHLRFEYERLQRQVMMRQQMYTSLSSSLQTARLQAVRDLPLIMTINEPAESARADARGTVLRTALGLVLGALFGVLLAFLRNAFRQTGQEAPEAARELRQLTREAMDELRWPLRRIRSRRS